MISCKKEETNDENPLVANNSNIVFGDYSTVSRVVPLGYFTYHKGNDTVKMDFDNDSIIDILLISNIDTLISNSNNVNELVTDAKVSIMPMHSDIFLESLEQHPLLYYSTTSDTFYTIADIGPPSGPPKFDTTEVRIWGKQQEHCFKMNSFDSLVDIGPVFYMQYFGSGNKFPEYSYWHNETIDIQSLIQGTIYPKHDKDTAHTVIVDLTSCGAYFLDVSWFGIKLVKNGLTQYGWIRIDPNGRLGSKGLEFALE